MNRRRFIFGLSGVLAASVLRQARAAVAWGPPWRIVPGVTVLSAASDPRLPLVNDAVAFWNRTLSALGSGFRLGAVASVADTMPPGALRDLSASTLGGVRRAPMPEWMRGWSGQIVVALSDDDFISFTQRWATTATALCGIMSGRRYPLTLPNVARNVIAHEMGHAIGLGHNADPTLLMCGRPAPCRPAAFQSTIERYFPLAADEQALLQRLYPADWRAG